MESDLNETATSWRSFDISGYKVHKWSPLKIFYFQNGEKIEDVNDNNRRVDDKRTWKSHEQYQQAAARKPFVTSSH